MNRTMRVAWTLSLAASASAFATLIQNPRPLPILQLHAVSNHKEHTFSKRKVAVKVVNRAVGALTTIALATSACPSASLGAAKKATTVKAAVKDAVVNINPDVVKAVGVFVGGSVVALLGRAILIRGKGKSKAAISKIDSVFPGALKNKDLVSKVSSVLNKHGYGKSSLVATSLGADEINRVLEKDFAATYNYNFHMGGLAGFPFGGVTAFGAMASHIPDGGSCLVVFGPSVGVDSTGTVGTVERRGRAKAGPCCTSAIAALNYVVAVKSGETSKAEAPKVPTDAQQTFIGNILLPYSERLEAATDKMVELPYVLYDAQKKMIMDIVKAGCGQVAGAGKIAVLGGIQINTPEGTSDYYKPISFELFDNSGKLLEDLSSALK